MSATLIGSLLDAALDYPRRQSPASALIDLKAMGELNAGKAVSKQAAAQMLLVNHLRRFRQPPADFTFSEDDDAGDKYEIEDIPTYRELARSLIRSKLPAPLTQFAESAKPDLVVGDEQNRPQAVFEIGYGFSLTSAVPAVDRLLHFAWSSRSINRCDRSIETVGYLFVHELSFGETIRDTERSIVDWIGETYGPFKGIERIGLPMMPRLTRTAQLSAHGSRLSAINSSHRPTSYVAFCISHEQMDG
ncbi:hypothetical protein [Bosea lathyri]|uniref:Uncharacterized protein n=1 Tax=Bosea lathyri TaxID=1036778 RepID=A0A1H6D2M5_9HYPH|nr:hypothetical protein [Bosea lathyri]SEG79248.1 hypothetical protein SAMN04488115_11449 [Bosea lathyri]